MDGVGVDYVFEFVEYVFWCYVLDLVGVCGGGVVCFWVDFEVEFDCDLYCV